MNYINMSIIYLFYEVFIILEIIVALISCSLSKAAENNGLIAVMSPLLAVPWPEWGYGLWGWWLLWQTTVMGGN